MSAVAQALFVVVCLIYLNGQAELVWSIVGPDRRTWPPPENQSFLRRAYGFFGALVVSLGVPTIGVMDWNSFVWDHWTRFVVGGLLIVPGGTRVTCDPMGAKVTCGLRLGDSELRGS